LTTTLIVFAHPDKRSFNGAWAESTERAAIAHGGDVLWSDLCAMDFDAVEAPRHYPGWQDQGHFDPLKVQEEAADANRLPGDVQSEIDKIVRADRVVFHFPLWWFAPPAILKGWFDRVFVHGALHSVDRRFDSGLCKPKKALLCVTTGATQAESAFNGKEGDIEMLLWPTAYTLHYLGFSVLKPETVHGVHGYYEGDEQTALQTRLTKVLENQNDLIQAFDARPQIGFNDDTDFDQNGRLRPDRQSHSHFIRHDK